MIVRELIAKFGLDFDQTSFNRADNAMSRIKAAAVGLVGVFAAGKAAQFLTGLVSTTANLADETVKAAQQYGLTAQALQSLNHAAELSGVSTTELGVALAQLSRNALSARNGSGEAMAGFRRLGVNVLDASGKLRSSDDLLGGIADGLNRLESPTERTALAMQLFGRSGARLIPLLSEGSNGIAKLRAEVSDLGATFGDDLLSNSVEMNDNLSRFRLLLQGLRNMIAGVLIPRINDLVLRFIMWRKANKEIIDQNLRAWTDRLSFGLGKIVDVCMALARIVSTLVGWFNSFSAASKAALGVTAAALLVIFAPLLLLKAAIAGIIVAVGLLIEDFIVFAQGGESLTGRLVNAFWEWLGTIDGAQAFLTALWEGVSRVFGGIRDAAFSLVQYWIDLFNVGLLQATVNFITNFAAAFADIFTPVGEALSAAVSTWQSQIESFFTWVIDKIQMLPSMLLGGIKNLGGTAFSAIGSLFGAGGGLPATSPSLGASPAAIAASKSGSSNISTSIEVHGAPGQDEGILADEIANRFRSMFDAEVSDAFAAHVPLAPRS